MVFFAESEPPLAAAVSELENRIATLTVRDDARLELAADFCGLFLMTDKQAALPYASAYKQDEQEIKRLLVEAGMETSGNFNEPADHLAIYLELLSHLHFRWERGPFLREESTVCGKNTDGTVGMVTRVCCALPSVRQFRFLRGTKPVIAGVSGMRPPKQIRRLLA